MTGKENSKVESRKGDALVNTKSWIQIIVSCQLKSSMSRRIIMISALYMVNVWLTAIWLDFELSPLPHRIMKIRSPCLLQFRPILLFLHFSFDHNDIEFQFRNFYRPSQFAWAARMRMTARKEMTLFSAMAVMPKLTWDACAWLWYVRASSAVIYCQ